MRFRLCYLVLHFWVGSFCDVNNNDRRFVFPREVIARVLSSSDLLIDFLTSSKSSITTF